MTQVSKLLRQVEHRPWPLPKKPWVMTQIWKSLLFAHWPVEPGILMPLIPEGLILDTFEGQAWISVVPFEMDFRMRCSPWVVQFGELNVRTYVIRDGKPGVFFFSLDANDFFMVHAARNLYELPYFFADIKVERTSEERVGFACRRLNQKNEEAQFKGCYQPVSPAFHAVKNTLDYWLTERYCLYAKGKNGRIFRGNVHHLPWNLRQAEVNIELNKIVQVSGLELPEKPTLLHYASSIEVVLWPLERA